MLKKTGLLLLALLLMLGLALPALAEQGAEPVGLPAVGDTVEGFTAKEIREFPLIGATEVLFEHEATGAQLMYIANDDTNRVFHLAFATRAHDNKGLPHVFEHATLSGSDKYPSKTLFFNLSYQTYNTFMNANTYNFMTTYPVASLSEEQLLRLADYYTDSCLHPSILKDESIYREEAWRYRLMSADEPLTLEGTVYSEMLGAMNLASWAQLYAAQDAFPGSTAAFETGGLPSDIPTMTFEELKNFHDLYYHPSNCCGILYGSFQDYTAFLKLLNEAFAPYEKKDFTEALADKDYVRITEPVTKSHEFAAEAGSDTANKSMVIYTFVCPDTTLEEELVLNTMTDVMVSESSDFMQSVQTALPSAQAGCYVNSYGPDFSVVFYALNVNPEDTETFKGLVDDALAKAAAEGFPQELIDNINASLTVSSRLIREDPDISHKTITIDTLYYWLADGTPWGFQNYQDALANVDTYNQQGLYAAAIAKYLVGSQTTALTTTYPVPGLKDEQDAALAAHLAETKAGMSEEEIAALVAASNEGDEDLPDPEMIASLQAVSVATLPEEAKEYEISDTTDEAGIRHINTRAAVEGIGQVDLMLDASGIAVDDLHDFKLLMDIVPRLNSKDHTRAELSSLSGLYLYNRSIRMSLLEDPNAADGFHVYLRLSWIAQDENLEKSYDLMNEFAFGLDLDDAQAVLEAVQAVKTNLRSSINNTPYNAQIYRAVGKENKLYRLYSCVNYLEYYAYLEQAEQALQSDPETFLAELKRVREQLRNATNAVALYSGSVEGSVLNQPLADAFLANLNHNEVVPVSYDTLPVPAQREALVVDSAVQYNLIQAGAETLGIKYTADMDALNNMVLDTYLYPLLRDQYGAYSVFHQSSDLLGMFTVSYRDPNVAQTFAVYEQLPELIAASEITQESLDGYILSAYSEYAKGSGELSGAVSAAIDLLEGKAADENVQRMRELKTLTPEKVKAYAEAYKAMAENGVRSTAGGAAVIAANADLYDVVLNPFNVVDASSVTLQDIAEDDPRYEAVRFAFDEKLMTAPDGVFGVDEPATKGDLACAVFAFAFGQTTDDPVFATENLAPYGLTAAGEVGDPLTVGETQTVLTTLTGLIGVPMNMEFPEDGPLTRADLAGLLKQYNDYLEPFFAE